MKEGGMDKLQGKKIVNIYHDSAYGKETIPVLDVQAKKYGFQVTHIAVPHPGNEQQAQWLLAQLQDWHRREDKAAFSEGYRLAELDDLDLLEEKAGLAGLKLLERLVVERKIPVDRYAFAKQETEARVEQDLYYQGEKFGRVLSIDAVEHTIDIKKTRKTAELHPTAVYVWERPLKVKEQTEALFRVGEWVATNGIEAAGRYRAGRDLLLRKRPRLASLSTWMTHMRLKLTSQCPNDLFS